MAYTKQTWADLPSKTTPINAERLTHIEDGIFNAAQTADTAASTAGTAAANVGIVSGRVETLTERVNGLDTAVSNKVDKVAGKGLSTNDYDDTDKGKVDSLGTASTKNSTSVVTQSSDLVESGAVYDALGFGNKNLLDPSIISASSLTYVPIYVGSGQFTCSSDVPLNGTGGANLFLLAGNVSDGASTGTSGVYTDVSRTVESVDGYVTIASRNVEGVDVRNYNNQLEKGSTATTYEPYHASVSDSLKKRVDWIDAKGYVGRNILPYPKGTRQVIASTGAITDNPDMYLSDYVSVKDFKALYLSCDYASVNIGVRIACFDGTKNFIKRDLESPTPNNPIVYQIGSNIEYVRFSIEDNPSGYYTNLMIEDSEIPIKTYEAYVPTNTELDSEKADNSVIGTVEDGATASQAYAVGSHAIRNGAFITWKNAKAQGETINDASDYTSGDISALNSAIDFSGDCNNLADGYVYYTSGGSHAPSNYCIIQTISNFGNTVKTQKAVHVAGGDNIVYIRSYVSGSGWSSWYKFEGTIVS